MESSLEKVRDFGVLSRLILPIAFASIAVYTIYGAIYRIFLTPIAHIPGPLFARLTFWNEFYYDVALGGKYTFKLKEYHEKYGGSSQDDEAPIVIDPRQDLSSESTRTKCTYWTRSSTNNYTCRATRGLTNGIGRYVSTKYT